MLVDFDDMYPTYDTDVINYSQYFFYIELEYTAHRSPNFVRHDLDMLRQVLSKILLTLDGPWNLVRSRKPFELYQVVKIVKQNHG